MTNREAFNQMIRQEIEEKIAFYEKMDTGLLVAGEYWIKENLHDDLCVYKINSTGKSVGSMQNVVDWLNSERTEEEEKSWQDSLEWNRQRVRRTEHADI